MNRRTATTLAVIAGLAVLIAAASLVPAQASRALEPSGEGWEYAELRLFGTDAVLQTAGGAVFLEGPSVREAREPIEIRGENLNVTRSLAVRHLTTIGSRGWEIVSPAGGEPGVFLLKRRVPLGRD